jgi:hypothetical protein
VRHDGVLFDNDADRIACEPATGTDRWLLRSVLGVAMVGGWGCRTGYR